MANNYGLMDALDQPRAAVDVDNLMLGNDAEYMLMDDEDYSSRFSAWVCDNSTDLDSDYTLVSYKHSWEV